MSVIVPHTEPTFMSELTSLLNKYSKENGSDTPDFILADYLMGCLENFDHIMKRRTEWYVPVESIEKSNETNID